MWNVRSGTIGEKYINNKLIIEIWLCLALSYYILCKTVGFQAGLALRHHFTAASESILRTLLLENSIKNIICSEPFTRNGLINNLLLKIGRVTTDDVFK